MKTLSRLLDWGDRHLQPNIWTAISIAMSAMYWNAHIDQTVAGLLGSLVYLAFGPLVAACALRSLLRFVATPSKSRDDADQW